MQCVSTKLRQLWDVTTCTFFTKITDLSTIFTYKDVSVCKLSHTRTCLFATCHLISHVYLDYHVSTQMCRLRDAFMRMFAHYTTSVCTLFWLTKSCLCVTFNPFATRPVAATGFQTTAAYYTRRGDGLSGSQMYLVVWVHYCAYKSNIVVCKHFA